ncbi:hypothetical protein PIROE2DRAFT_11683 [Piromyces sp. E2]|nr:hypothetical protein PIROE2DRAFT_11683 [Piromyces sp. E2]|eukprot:OUM62129.1 hypothetical protein PIROE2DRAFT_11683 [Piromyces sp. E2]
MYHQFSMNDWLWFWINFLFDEVKTYIQKNLCRNIIQENKNANELLSNEIMYIYIDYLQMGIILENNHSSETTNNLFTADIMEFMEVLKDFNISKVSSTSIISIGKSLIENKFLYSTLASELYAYFLKEIISLKSFSHSTTTSFYIEMVI